MPQPLIDQRQWTLGCWRLGPAQGTTYSLPLPPLGDQLWNVCPESPESGKESKQWYRPYFVSTDSWGNKDSHKHSCHFHIKYCPRITRESRKLTSWTPGPSEGPQQKIRGNYFLLLPSLFTRTAWVTSFSTLFTSLQPTSLFTSLPLSVYLSTIQGFATIPHTGQAATPHTAASPGCWWATEDNISLRAKTCSNTRVTGLPRAHTLLVIFQQEVPQW